MQPLCQKLSPPPEKVGKPPSVPTSNYPDFPEITDSNRNGWSASKEASKSPNWADIPPLVEAGSACNPYNSDPRKQILAGLRLRRLRLFLQWLVRDGRKS